MTLTQFKVSKTDNPVLIPPPGALDLHYPSDDDEPMADTESQYYAITDAVFALKLHLQRLDRAATVRGNCALYYDPGRLTAYVAPDVLLAYDVDLPGTEGYAPWVYGKVPDLVMEMAAPTTHNLDSGPKKSRYADLGIAEYWQYDPHHEYLEHDLMGWHLRDGRYESIPLTYDTQRGALIGVSQVLGTDWGLESATGALRLWNHAAQSWYPTDREAEAARATEAARADRAEAELAKLRDQIRELEAGSN